MTSSPNATNTCTQRFRRRIGFAAFDVGVVVAAPFTAAVACEDYGFGSKWWALHIVADEGNGVFSTALNAHGS